MTDFRRNRPNLDSLAAAGKQAQEQQKDARQRAAAHAKLDAERWKRKDLCRAMRRESRARRPWLSPIVYGVLVISITAVAIPAFVASPIHMAIWIHLLAWFVFLPSIGLAWFIESRLSLALGRRDRAALSAWHASLPFATDGALSLLATREHHLVLSFVFHSTPPDGQWLRDVIAGVDRRAKVAVIAQRSRPGCEAPDDEASFFVLADDEFLDQRLEGGGAAVELPRESRDVAVVVSYQDYYAIHWARAWFARLVCEALVGVHAKHPIEKIFIGQEPLRELIEACRKSTTPT